ncbi:hypothetical protein EV421DRAFT_309894 [Armillaria borealis]|uniref:Uncharacterized protein n=1 Tax=Armillaria borealis TaxID=47425 RepID=A0AA39ITT4_9AGAR|nr:hypothetical protein EV421DRAFT_309894 [Armillaria borealis]
MNGTAYTQVPSADRGRKRTRSGVSETSKRSSVHSWANTVHPSSACPDSSIVYLGCTHPPPPPPSTMTQPSMSNRTRPSLASSFTSAVARRSVWTTPATQVAPGQSARSVSRSVSMSGYGGRLSSVRRDFPGSAHQTSVNGMVHERRPSYEDLLQEVEDLRSMRQHQPAGSNFDPAVATLFGHNGRALVARDHHAVPLYDPTVINLPWEVKHNLRHGMRHYPRLTSFSLEACREDAAKPLGPRERQQCFVGVGGTLKFSVPLHKAASEESVKTYDEWLGLTIQMTQGLKDDLDLGDGI